MADQTSVGVEFLQEPVRGVSVIIPCKNEACAIDQVILQVHQTLDATSIDYEIIVVDDGSTDCTRQAALEAGARVLVHNINMGYGNSIMDGMTIARYPVIAILDGDGTYPIAMLPAMIEQAGAHDMVIGTRAWNDVNTSLMGRVMRRLLYYVILYFSNHRAPDYNSGLRVFHKLNILNFRPILCPTFSFSTSLTLLYLLSMRSILFMDIEYAPRIGKSKVAYVRDAIRAFSYVFIISSLFQPYRMAGIFILLELAINGLITLLGLLLHISWVLPLGLYIGLSLGILIGMLSLIAYPMAKLYLEHLGKTVEL
jgi:polyisoprenyl-phosphate glycosyltransferase